MREDMLGWAFVKLNNQAFGIKPITTMCCLICWKQSCKAHTIANQASICVHQKRANNKANKHVGIG